MISKKKVYALTYLWFVVLVAFMFVVGGCSKNQLKKSASEGVATLEFLHKVVEDMKTSPNEEIRKNYVIAGRLWNEAYDLELLYVRSLKVWDGKSDTPQMVLKQYDLIMKELTGLLIKLGVFK